MTNPKTGPKNLREAALEYAEQGKHVFPCYPATKIPMTENGFKDATTDPVQIKKWWAENPEANIGLRTGSTGEKPNPDDIWVLDLDPRDKQGNLTGVKESVKTLKAEVG